MAVLCYVCNYKTNVGYEKLAIAESKHSKTLIVEFIRKFQHDFLPQRNLYDESNVICSGCLSRIHAYDWMCEKIKDEERELHALLVKTEFNLKMDIKHEKNDGEFGVEHAMEGVQFDDTDQKESKIDIQQNLPDLNQRIKAAESVKKGKPIIIRVVKRVPFLKKHAAQAASRESASGKSNSIKTASETLESEHSASLKTASKESATQQLNTKSNELRSETPELVWLSNENSLKVVKKNHKYICEYCEIGFLTLSILERHFKMHSFDDSDGIFCHLCGFKLKDVVKFREHLQKHNDVGLKQCVICNENGPNNFNLKQHVKVKHGGKMSNTVLCETCGKEFINSRAWRTHQLTHIDDRPEKCPHCDKAFKRKYALNKHIRTHTHTEKKFACIFCGKQFHRKDHLRAHEKRHREDTRTNKCTFCPAAFEGKKDLTLHLKRKHDAEIPHEKIRTFK